MYHNYKIIDCFCVILTVDALESVSWRPWTTFESSRVRRRNNNYKFQSWRKCCQWNCCFSLALDLFFCCFFLSVSYFPSVLTFSCFSPSKPSKVVIENRGANKTSYAWPSRRKFIAKGMIIAINVIVYELLSCMLTVVFRKFFF